MSDHALERRLESVYWDMIEAGDKRAPLLKDVLHHVESLLPADDETIDLDADRLPMAGDPDAAHCITRIGQDRALYKHAMAAKRKAKRSKK